MHIDSPVYHYFNSYDPQCFYKLSCQLLLRNLSNQRTVEPMDITLLTSDIKENVHIFINTNVFLSGYYHQVALYLAWHFSYT
jgi:hypothetical protein